MSLEAGEVVVELEHQNVSPEAGEVVVEEEHLGVL